MVCDDGKRTHHVSKLWGSSGRPVTEHVMDFCVVASDSDKQKQRSAEEILRGKLRKCRCRIRISFFARAEPYCIVYFIATKAIAARADGKHLERSSSRGPQVSQDGYRFLTGMLDDTSPWCKRGAAGTTIHFVEGRFYNIYNAFMCAE
jgi:hypothetical protein